MINVNSSLNKLEDIITLINTLRNSMLNVNNYESYIKLNDLFIQKLFLIEDELRDYFQLIKNITNENNVLSSQN